MSQYLKAVTPAIVREIIRLAQERRTAIDAEDGIYPKPKFQALYDHLLSLTNAQKNELMALMWLGRGTAGESPEMWSDLIYLAEEDPEEGKADYLSIAHLGTYLIDGLMRLGE